MLIEKKKLLAPQPTVKKLPRLTRMDQDDETGSPHVPNASGRHNNTDINNNIIKGTGVAESNKDRTRAKRRDLQAQHRHTGAVDAEESRDTEGPRAPAKAQKQQRAKPTPRDANDLRVCADVAAGVAEDDDDNWPDKKPRGLALSERIEEERNRRRREIAARSNFDLEEGGPTPGTTAPTVVVDKMHRLTIKQPCGSAREHDGPDDVVTTGEQSRALASDSVRPKPKAASAPRVR